MKPHVVVLCLDSLRKDFYDTHAPQLQDLSTFRFEEMRALSSWSVPSHAGLLTGKVPSESGVHAKNRNFTTIKKSWTTEIDYRKVCISSNVYASGAFGFDEFFDETIPISPSCRFPKGMDMQLFIQEREHEDFRSYLEFIKEMITHDEPVATLLNGAIFKLDELLSTSPMPKFSDYGCSAVTSELERVVVSADNPTFVFVNIMDIHGPHTPFRGLNCTVDPEFDSKSFADWDVNTADDVDEFEDELEKVRKLYAAEVEYVDKVVSETIRNIQRKTSRDVAFVITSDHGENLGYPEDGYLMNHISSLSESLLHVPFEVVHPTIEGVEESLTSHADMEEIVRRLIEGISLDGLERDTIRAEIVGSGSGLPDENQEFWDRGQRAVYTGSKKYLWDDHGDESVIADGDVVSQTIPIEIKEEFGEWVVAPEKKMDIDASTESRLKDLGYL